MRNDNYVVASLELHLFFGRIMKEHALFLRAGFTPVDTSFSNQTEFYRREFENLLGQVVMLSDGVVSQPVLSSGELATEFTILAEKQTERLSGISINQEITEDTLNLRSKQCRCSFDSMMFRQVQQLNRTALRLLNGFISLKEEILSRVLRGEMFTMNYPLLIEHITREAKLYREYLEILERQGHLSNCSMRETECFWNQIMMEHAQFIRGLLDPCEVKLMNSADDFAKDFEKLLEHCRCAQARTMTKESLTTTLKFRDFKAVGTQGIQQCKIRSVMLPLLADHVLREANHYIRLLQD